MIYNTTAYINCADIKNNLDVIKEKLNPATKIMVAVKGNAYGHGMIEFSQKLYELGVRHFAVACLDSAVKLREHIADCEILILGFTHPSMASVVAENNITQTIYGLDFAKQLSEECKKQSVTVSAHLAFDTGMNRIGFQSAKEAIDAAKLEGIKVCGAFTHFSCADIPEKDDFTRAQFDKFVSTVNEMKNAGIALDTCHCANSAAIFRFPEFQMDMVRAGIVVYGLSPNPQDKQTYKDIKPVMEIKAFVSHVKWVEAGQSIGYGAAFTASQKMRVATVTCGYGDGYSIPYSKGFVLVSGKRAKIVGRICMDQFMIDVTDIPEAEIFNEVTLLGSDGNETILADELAVYSDSINYQVVTSLTSRVNKIYR